MAYCSDTCAANHVNYLHMRLVGLASSLVTYNPFSMVFLC
jgi:hypothetical protein